MYSPTKIDLSDVFTKPKRIKIDSLKLCVRHRFNDSSIVLIFAKKRREERGTATRLVHPQIDTNNSTLDR